MWDLRKVKLSFMVAEVCLLIYWNSSITFSRFSKGKKWHANWAVNFQSSWDMNVGESRAVAEPVIK